MVFLVLFIINLSNTVRPVVSISSSSGNSCLPIGANITLTCTAQPRDEDSVYLDRWVDYIEWYDSQGRRVGVKCRQPSNIHAHKLKLSCPLVLKDLTVEKFGPYTCQAGNGYLKHCTRRSFEIRIQGKQTKLIIPLRKDRYPVFFNAKVDAECWVSLR